MNEPDLELLAVFREEARDLIEALTRTLLDLEIADDAQQRQARIQEVFRLAHTIKGSAAIVGLKEFAEVAHALETHLERVRRGELNPSQQVIGAALQAIDVLQRGLEVGLTRETVDGLKATLVASAQAPRPTAPRPSAPAGRRKKKPPAAEPAPSAPTLPAQTPVTLATGLLRDLSSPDVSSSALAGTLEALRAAASERGRKVIDGVRARLTEKGPRPIEALMTAADFLIADVTSGTSDEEVGAVLKLLQPAGITPEAPNAHTHVPSNPSTESWVRVPVSLLDGMLYRLDELVAVRLRLDYLRRQVELVQAHVEFASVNHEETDGQTEVRRLEPIRRDLAQEVHVLDLLAQALQDAVKEVRMVTAGPILAPLRRAVRETAAALGKEAVLEVKGEDVRVDKRHFDLMRDPLMHLVRNAIDHGIESPEERRRAGKPERGQIEVIVEAHSAHLFIEVRDDGRGIHRARLIDTAVERGIVERERAATLTDREVMNFIFLPGFSTAADVTELSGRGVGMDVVRENVARIGGRIDFYSDPGKGTQFKFTLPLTLSGSRGLMVVAGQQTYCLPLTAVDEVVTVEPGEVHASRDQLAIQWRKQAVQFVSLADVLGQRASARPSVRLFAAVLVLADRRLALGIDQLLGEEEIIVKGLAAGTPRLPFVVGATTRSDGKLITVLDPMQLGEAALGLAARPLQAGGRGARSSGTVLVVDDALTTRSLVSSVLERAGFRTFVASDGEAALLVLADEQVDLVVTDAEMPHLDGFGLVKRIRASARLAALPVILMTSLDGPADRARGADAGASAYIVKSSFQPSAFLSMVSEFIGPRGEA